MALTSKQERFCREYLIDLNATQAAKRAGYSETSAHSTGSENLKKPEIAARIQCLQAERAERVEIQADDVVRELAAMAMSNPQDYMLPDGTVIPLHQLSRELAAAVSPVTADDGSIQYTLPRYADKRAAIVDLGRHLGIFEADNRQKAPDAEQHAPDLATARLLAFALSKAAESGAEPAADGGERPSASATH